MRDVFKIYGVKNDDQIQKLLDFLTLAEVPFEFLDFRDNPPTDEQLISWAEYENMDYILNTKSRSFKEGEKKFNSLKTDKEKFDWIRKNYHLIIRPIIENEAGEILSIGGRPERVAKVVFNITP